MLDAPRAAARLPLGNALAQSGGATLSIVAGHSVGREGPAITSAPPTGSLAGQLFKLSEAELRGLVACGVAAAIAASFDTPLAGVVFAMEVVVMDYRVVAFAPVILGAVRATAITPRSTAATRRFQVPTFALRSLWELPYMVGVGAAIGLLSRGIHRAPRVLRRAREAHAVLARRAFGALAVGCGAPTPEIMGIGYDRSTQRWSASLASRHSSSSR